VQARHRHQVELQLGDDAEVALAAAQRPEQLGSLIASTRRTAPSAVTSSTLRTWSAAKP
jgi:hypothetical protein